MFRTIVRAAPGLAMWWRRLSWADMLGVACILLVVWLLSIMWWGRF